MSLPKPTIKEVARALLLVAATEEIEPEVANLVARSLLPHTAPEAADKVMIDVREYINRARHFFHTDWAQARAWFCDPGCNHPNTPGCKPEKCERDGIWTSLHEWGNVWRGEAETTAETAALYDSIALETYGGKWVVPGVTK